MKQIRYNTFETNSSSNHSLHMPETPPARNFTIIPDEDGVITLRGGGYGHGGGEKYNDALTKANYIATGAIRGTNWGDEDDEHGDISEEDLPYLAQCLIQAVREHTGAKKVVIDLRPDAYIDHQSGGAWNTLFKHTGKTYTNSWGDTEHEYEELDSCDVERLKDFIFDSEAYLLSDEG